MLFYLTSIGLALFLTKKSSKLKEDETDNQDVIAIKAWKHFEKLITELYHEWAH